MFFYFFSKIYIIYTKPYKKRYLSVHRKSEKKLRKKQNLFNFLNSLRNHPSII